MTILCIFAIQTSVPLKFRSETTPFSKGVASKTKLAISKKKVASISTFNKLIMLFTLPFTI